MIVEYVEEVDQMIVEYVEEVEQILVEHKPEPLPEDVAQTIKAIVRRAEERVGG